MAETMGYMRAFDEDLRRRGEQPKGHGIYDTSNVAGAMSDREGRSQQAAQTELPPMKAPETKQKGKSDMEGAQEGLQQGMATGNPYIAAATTAMGVIGAQKDREAAAFQNKKTGQQNALAQYINIIGGMA